MLVTILWRGNPEIFKMAWYFLLSLLFSCNNADEFQILSSDLIKIFNNFDCIEASTLQTGDKFGDNYDLYEKIAVNSSNINTNKRSLLSTIHELAQYNEITYDYVVVSENGPAHSKLYRIELNLGDEQYEGEGGSLKKAQNAAAQLALSQTAYTIPPEKVQINQLRQTPTVILNNIAAKLGIKVSYQLDDKNLIAVDGNSNQIKLNYYQKLNLSNLDEDLPVEDPQITGPFVVKLFFDNEEFLGYGHTVQAARHNAAVKALNFVKKQADYRNHICNVDESDESCRRKRENLKSPVSQLHELAQKRQFRLEFNVVEESGKDHRKKFVTQCRIGDDLVTSGVGNSKKESKRIAAENMLGKLADLQNFENFNENEILQSFNLNNKKTNKKKKSKKLMRNDDNFIKSATNMLNSIFTTDEVKNNKFTPKQKLLEISNLLKVDIKFNNLGRNDEKYYTILYLGIRPPYICLGEATTEDGSAKNAAINGLKFLKKTDIFDNLPKDNQLNSVDIDVIIDNDIPDNVEES